MNSSLKDKNFAGMTKKEMIAALAEAYDETAPEMADLAQKLTIPARMLREMEMPEGRIWATIVQANAEALELDLDDPADMAVAAILAHYQMQS